MDTDTIQRVDIEEKMRSAYLSYAMSVITARALPDVRDGLKPGQRRILYAMHDMGIRHDRPTRKSARIVGEVLGKYHPHGDQAVYDAMVRMAQDFSLRYPLVEGQGNFGSVDGDGAAAMRYTEARLEQIGEEMLLDLAKDTVDFQDNFDGSLQEPTVLPSRLPNLLVNGVGGIAVGMATNIPPHNLGEVVDAVAYMLDRYDNLDDITVDDLMRFIPGPDFPTAGSIYGRDGIRQAYATGKGRITVRALAHMEEMGQGKKAIIVTEIPYQVNKATLVERIAKLVRDERVDGIADLRDESDRTGMRIVIELKRGVQEGPVMQALLKYTQLQTTFGVNMLALVNGEPRSLTLKRCLTHFINHRIEVIERRTRYDLERARARADILEGLLIALDNLDEVIATIRRSKTAETARKNLCRKFKLSELQATAILDMQLRRLAALERRRIQEEYKEVQARIEYLEGLLDDRAKILAIIREDALETKKLYGDARRTAICDEEASSSDGFKVASMVPSEAVYVLLTRGGTIRRLTEDTYRSRRTTVPGMKASERDVMQAHVLADAQDRIYIVTNRGRAVCLPAHQLPDGTQQTEGLPVAQLVRLDDDERPIALFCRKEMPKALLAMATSSGRAKRLDPSELDKLNRMPTTVMKLEENDAIVSAMLAAPGSEALFVTQQGKAIRIALETVRPQGLAAGGVQAITLQDDDAVAGMDLARDNGQLVLATASGFCKRVDVSEYNTQGRRGQGVLTVDPSKQSVAGHVVGMCVVTPADELILTASKHKMIRMSLTDIPSLDRGTWGRLVTRTKRNAVIPEDQAPVLGLVAMPNLGEPPRTTRGTASRSKTAKDTTIPASGAKPRNSKRRTSASAKPKPKGRSTTKKPDDSPTTLPKSSSNSPSTAKAPAEDEPQPPSDQTSDRQSKPASATRRSRRSTTRKPPTRRKKS